MFLKLSNRHEWLLAIRDDYCGELTWKIKYSFPLFWKWRWAGRDCCKTSRLCLYLSQLLMGSWSETQAAWVCSLRLLYVTAAQKCAELMLRLRWEFTTVIFPSDLPIIKQSTVICKLCFLSGRHNELHISWSPLGWGGAGVESWPQRWAVRWCCPACTIPRGGPGTLEAVLEVRTSFMLSKILGCNGCLEPPDIFCRAPSPEALFLPLLPYVFPAGPLYQSSTLQKVLIHSTQG